MANSGFDIPKKEWLEELHELAKKNEIYMRFEFRSGHILAKPSKLLVGDNTTLLLQRLSEPSGPDPIELFFSLPGEELARYEKRVNEADGVCLSIIYLMRVDNMLFETETLHLSNQEDFLNREDSESLLQ